MSAVHGKASNYTIGHSEFEAPALAPGLYLVATPIGNLGDISLRALETLAASDMLYCEDTRITSRLCARYKIARTLKPYHDYNAAKVRSQIIGHLSSGMAISLVSDAGTPLISDPGFKLVEECIANNVKVQMIPGPSALVHALAISGISPESFFFAGFLPAKQKERQRALSVFGIIRSTLIFYESPHRIVESLSDIAAVLGSRSIAVARELTKFHEEVLRGSAVEIHEVLKLRPSIKGEFTIVVAPPEDEIQHTDDNAILKAIDEHIKLMPLSKAASKVAKQFGRPRREVYELGIRRAESHKHGDDENKSD